MTVANKQARLDHSRLSFVASLPSISSDLRTENYSQLVIRVILKMIVFMYSSWNSKERYCSRPPFTLTSNV